MNWQAVHSKGGRQRDQNVAIIVNSEMSNDWMEYQTFKKCNNFDVRGEYPAVYQ